MCIFFLHLVAPLSTIYSLAGTLGHPPFHIPRILGGLASSRSRLLPPRLHPTQNMPPESCNTGQGSTRPPNLAATLGFAFRQDFSPNKISFVWCDPCYL